jgi:hypothetical protein
MSDRVGWPRYKSLDRSSTSIASNDTTWILSDSGSAPFITSRSYPCASILTYSTTTWSGILDNTSLKGTQGARTVTGRPSSVVCWVTHPLHSLDLVPALGLRTVAEVGPALDVHLHHAAQSTTHRG